MYKKDMRFVHEGAPFKAAGCHKPSSHGNLEECSLLVICRLEFGVEWRSLLQGKHLSLRGVPRYARCARFLARVYKCLISVSARPVSGTHSDSKRILRKVQWF